MAEPGGHQGHVSPLHYSPLIDPYCGRHVTHPLRLSPRHPLPLGRPMMRGVMRKLTSMQDLTWGVFDHASCAPQLRSCIAYNPPVMLF